MVSFKAFVFAMVGVLITFPAYSSQLKMALEGIVSSVDLERRQESVELLFRALREQADLRDGDIRHEYVQALKAAVDTLEKVGVFSSALKDYYILKNSLAQDEKSSASDSLHPFCVHTSKANVVIYYINGMFNSELDVVNSVEKLRSFTPPQMGLGPDNALEVRALYNENEPVFHQLAQVTANKLGDTFAMFWDYYYYLEQAPEWFQKDYFDKLVSVVGGAFRNDSSPRNFNALGSRFGELIYSQMATEGILPILVGHSQGGLYVNAASRYLTHKMSSDRDARQYYGTIVLGSPVQTLHSSLGNDILREDDFVMRLVRLAVGTRAPDYRGLAKSADRLQHNFVKAYLEDERIQRDFLSSIGDIFRQIIPYSANKPYARFSLSADCEASFYGSKSTWFSSLEVTPYSPSSTSEISCRMFKSAVTENDSRSHLRVSLTAEPRDCSLEARIEGRSMNLAMNLKEPSVEEMDLCLTPTRNQIKVSECSDQSN